MCPPYKNIQTKSYPVVKIGHLYSGACARRMGLIIQALILYCHYMFVCDPDFDQVGSVSVCVMLFLWYFFEKNRPKLHVANLFALVLNF